jgi:hypothetical protein
LVLDRVGSALPDPDRYPGHADLDLADPDRCQFQANEKVDKVDFFQKNLYMLSKILKTYTHLTLMRKGKRLKSGNAVA